MHFQKMVVAALFFLHFQKVKKRGSSLLLFARGREEKDEHLQSSVPV